MKYIKTFEVSMNFKNSINQPEIGDYVICEDTESSKTKY